MASLFERITPSELSLTATSRIFVAHLAVGTSLEDVIMAFEEFGRIEECTLIQKYQYREIQVSAVIRFASIGQAVHAASVMDGVTANGLSLQVAIIPEGSGFGGRDWIKDEGEETIWQNTDLNIWEREFVSQYSDQVTRYQEPSPTESTYIFKSHSMDEFKEQQRLINAEVKGNMQEVQSNMREMKEMFKMFLNQAKAPETYQYQQPLSLDHQPDLQPVPSPEDSQFKSQSEIFLPVEKTKVMLDVKKLNFHFKDTEVETFIRRVEKLANLQGAGGPDVASQLPFLDSITTLISKHANKGGIQNREEYRSFVSDLEEILAYLTKMGYNDMNAGSGEPLWKAILAEMRKDVAKELVHDKKFKKTKDGIALIPNLEPLKEYVEAALLVLDLEEGLSKTPSVSKKPETKKEVKTQPKEEAATGKVSELEEEIKKLRTVLNTNQNARQLLPHMQPNFRPQNYGPPGMGPPPFLRPQFKCYYCDSTEHSSMFRPKLPEDIANKLVIRSGPNYYYPNREPIPTGVLQQSFWESDPRWPAGRVWTA
ncbi:hypothetical protein H4Q26_008382 [Puccinia striiformis f. sp. tritici PST-130]|nr:hypothetical protein H4Q26_008382 [Puccinia striiformis f. sp. tritici PST-130]